MQESVEMIPSSWIACAGDKNMQCNSVVRNAISTTTTVPELKLENDWECNV